MASEQKPIEGVSMLDTLNNAEAKSHRTTQYFEMAGNRGIYQDGWFATTVHRPPWEPKPRATFAERQVGALQRRGRLQLRA